MSGTELETREVVLSSIGLTLILSQSNWRISRKKDKLEREGTELIAKMKEEDTLQPGDDAFIETFYPLIAAAVVSNNCPSWEVCVEKVKENELDEWYAKARELNPHWFVLIDKIVELSAREEETETETKKEKIMNLISDEKTQEKSLTE